MENELSKTEQPCTIHGVISCNMPDYLERKYCHNCETITEHEAQELRHKAISSQKDMAWTCIDCGLQNELIRQ